MIFNMRMTPSLAAVAAVTAITSAALTIAAPAPTIDTPYHIDLRHYFPSAAEEQRERMEVLSRVNGYVDTPVSSLDSPEALRRWLATYDELSKTLQAHDIYVYLRAEENTTDFNDAAADSVLGNAIRRLDYSIRSDLRTIGGAKLRKLMARDQALTPYRYLILSALEDATHLSTNENAVNLLATPALDSLARSYRNMRPRQPEQSKHVDSRRAARAAFEAKWRPYATHEATFAALLLAVVRLQTGKARLRGFASAPAAAYFSDELTIAEVNRTLHALRRSDAYQRYVRALAGAAARGLRIPRPDIHVWDLNLADGYRPPLISFPDAVPIILSAERAGGSEYAGQFDRLFSRASHRVEWCNAPRCDHSGFSVGYAGVISGLFYGAYDGSTNAIRALAHEAGHAVHREFMNENQPLAAYNSGPKFMFESFAVFNGSLILDHMYETAATPAAKAYYLHRFIANLIFNVYGSADEVALEQAIYSGVRSGTIHSAADLDALTLKVFAQFTPPKALSSQMRDYWAWDPLYYRDPLYDVNYLFAGLLAIQYLERLKAHPHEFRRRYVALLKNGFTSTPRELERKFLGIDLADSDRLVEDANRYLTGRASVLAALYRARK